MYDSLKGKVALVTGGTKGIGKAIADKLSASGAIVITTARTEANDNSSNHHFIAADLTQADSAEKIAKEILEKYGKIDIIVNNVGANLSPGGGFNTLEDEHWLKDWELNFLSVVRMNKALLPTMLEQKEGIIINISTGAAKQPIWEMTMSYSSAKAALNAYSKALANEVGSKGIRVNSVSPGVVRTPLMNDFIENIAKQSGTSFEESFQNVIDAVGVPIGRMAEPEEIANTVAFLASSEGLYITGANISVDGGAAPTV
ncbi:SDR family oxidoreductase [Elizabethkingia meningoseptica]|uniref:SDR family oxidoreductase n=1 Tax=Elizabethkingia meningoseptica TaxID=238 RepID=UPI0022F1728F|nr:SDR family oxidoreductase [Elizabethkingia meningoseptica]EJK5328107.1 SDR family oxidoreductase [Elizabethkingia meningoseptica]WBS74130.1 SDR family oxidoreductase [Elizabethkingia meningoseptica]